jgi:60 kDa SS-A/Ro ribonucleoprotein
MAKINTKSASPKTHEGGKSPRYVSSFDQLRRAVMACFLWEDSFYESGQDVVLRIQNMAKDVKHNELAALAVEARTKMNLRHIPLMLAAILCKEASGTSLVSETIYKVICRADELAEFVAIYAKVNGVKPSAVKKVLSAQAKKGLALAFGKFDEHQLAKYNRDGDVKLRDVLFLCHAKPKDEERKALYKRVAENKLKTPDTWEVALSGGADKGETFTRLIKEDKLGYLALLRNLRNMTEAGVSTSLIQNALLAGKRSNIMPFRFVAAARACPQLEPVLDKAMSLSIDALPLLRGTTVVLVDVSGSMDRALSAKSDMMRIDAAAALASVVNAEKLRVFSFSNDLIEVPPRRGMAGVDAIVKSQKHSNTRLKEALEQLHEKVTYDRIIVITDEQSNDGITDPKGKGYLINVATYKNGVGYGAWTHIDGFSENTLKYIHEIEGEHYGDQSEV